MISARWLSSLKALVSAHPSTVVPDILVRDEFRRLLARERCRADRVDSDLSLVVIDLSGAAWGDVDPTRFLFGIQSRVRDTDAVGWFDRSRLGILLTDTNSIGALRVTEDLRDRVLPTLPGARWRIYTYPAERLPDQDSDQDSDRNDAPRGGSRKRTRQAERPQRRATTVGAARRSGSPFEAFELDGSNSPALRTERSERSEAPVEFAPLVAALQPRRSACSRALDVALAVLGLLIASPVLLAAGVAIKCTSPGPVFFRQQRMGQGGRPFTFYKLRTMCVDAEARKKDLLALNEQAGPVFKLTRDPRITPIGRILRKTSIDELPQLWNVLRGDMTFVGPRPPLPDEVREYTRWQRRRLDLAGGLTCIWQISGRSQVQFEDWVRMDLRYGRKASFWLDLKILALTVPAVVTGRGAR